MVVPECQVPGVPANMQCSYNKSEKCSKVANTSASTAGPPLQTTKPITTPREPVTIPPTAATIQVPLEPAGKQVVSAAANGSSPNAAIIGAAIGGTIFVVLILVLVLLLVRYFKAKRRQACNDDNNVTNGDIEMQGSAKASESDGGEEDEPNAEDALLENNEEVPLSDKETLDSDLPIGTQDTQPPGTHSSTGKLF